MSEKQEPKVQKPEKEKINKIVRQFIWPTSITSFRLITVYENHSIMIGSEQEVRSMGLKELAVK